MVYVWSRLSSELPYVEPWSRTQTYGVRVPLPGRTLARPGEARARGLRCAVLHSRHCWPVRAAAPTCGLALARDRHPTDRRYDMTL